MTFAFVHTADWQIGKPFGGMPADKVPLLREARIGAAGRVAAIARSNGAQHVLVAGDVFDARDVPDRDLHQCLDRLRRESDLTWHLLPGNHDPAQPGGIWDRVQSAGVPDNVQVHLLPRPVMIATNVALMPAPLTSRSTSVDPTAWMDETATPSAAYRIGLAHGSVHGFSGGDGEAAVPIAPTRARSAGLGYLALGDWHGATRITERVWYSGTPEPDRFPDNEPGFALAVRLDGPDRPPEVQRWATAHYTWIKHRLDMTSTVALTEFGRALEAQGPFERLLVSVALAGAASLRAWSEAEERLGSLEHVLFHLTVDKTGLRVLPEVIELESFGAGDLRQAAERLSAIARDPAHPKAAAASLALQKLYLAYREIGQGGRR